MTSYVALRELLRRGMTRTVESASDVDVDAKDPDACLDLLRAMAKRHRLKPADCEITVKTGRTTKTYRVGAY